MPPSRDCRDSGLVHYAPAKRDDIAPLHSITRSARAGSVGGTARPSAVAALALVTAAARSNAYLNQAIAL